MSPAATQCTEAAGVLDASKETAMDGKTVLGTVIEALESIDTEDRFYPFCRLLLRIVRPVVEDAP